jgi:hypothetical protein
MPQEKRRRTATAETIAALIRIYRSAVASGDEKLAQSTATSLLQYGIKAGDLTIDGCQNQGGEA